MRTVLSTLLCLIVIYRLTAQAPSEKMTPSDYVNKFKDIAIKSMQENGIPASITLAQGMLESGNGNSPLARNANNHFGIKCHAGWQGKTYIQDDDTKNECFRKYKTVLDSYQDHAHFLRHRQRYSFLFDYDVTDYKAWAHGLKKAGYATNPRYPELLISIIERHELHKYDKMSSADLTNKAIIVKKNRKEPQAPKTTGSRNETYNDITVSIGSRVIHYNNNVKYVYAQNGDDVAKLAKELEMFEWQIKKYNDLQENTKFSQGEILYIQPKRNKAQSDFHKISKGETMLDVSQKYAIKLKTLYRKNNMLFGEEPAEGSVLYLRKRKPAKAGE